MEFEFKEYKNKKISDNQLLENIKDVCKQNNLTSLSMAEYEKFGKYDISTIIRRFGTWNTALNLANIDIRNRSFSEQELFDNLKNVWISKGKQPTRRDMDNKNLSYISSGAYYRKYGSWSNALKSFIDYINQTDTNFNDITTNKCENNHSTSRDVNLRLRFKVLQRDNFKCKICGASPATNPNIILHVDHIKPYSKGGETVLENLQTLCSNCNLGKSDLI
jgi:hypothetical protein